MGFDGIGGFRGDRADELGWREPIDQRPPARYHCSNLLENPLILVTDKRVSVLNDIVPILEQVLSSGERNFVVIADDVDFDALTALVINKLRGTVNALAVKAPGFGDRQKEMLEDIATLVGATVISESMGRKIENATLADLGRAERVIAKKEETTIVGGSGDQSAIDARVRQIKAQIEDATSDYDKEKLNERLAKIVGGVAVLSIGGATESEQKERKYRVEDALNATRAAAVDGIVAGGGVALLNAARALDSLSLQDEEAVGAQILRRALEEPARQIAENAGLEGAVSVGEIRKRAAAAKNPNIGFDVIGEQYVDMVKEGIIDPVKVTRSALENAVSVAGMILTTEALVTEIPTPEPPMPAMPDMDDY